jgi:hypothetical protein
MRVENGDLISVPEEADPLVRHLDCAVVDLRHCFDRLF